MIFKKKYGVMDMGATTEELLYDVDVNRRKNAELNVDGLAFALKANEKAAHTTQELEEQNRETLIAEYTRLRHEEYEMTVLNEAMKMYNVCNDAGVKNINSDLWYGLKKTKGAENTAAGLVPQITSYRGPNATCAISASALTLQINRKINEGCPQGVETSELIANDGKVNIKTASTFAKNPAAQGYVYTGDKTLNELMLDKNCPLNVGDAISLRMKKAYVSRKTGQQRSGCHAMLLTDVTRDDDGNVTSYTLQGNNPTYLATYQRKGNTFVCNNKEGYGNKKVESAILTHKWMENQILAENKYLESLSVAELQAQVLGVQNRVYGEVNPETLKREGGLLGNLAETEKYNLLRGYNKAIGDAYLFENDTLMAENFHLINENTLLMARSYANEKVPDALLGKRAKEVEAPVKLSTIDSPETGETKAKKKNIFQKVGKWFANAAKDTADWCESAYKTVVLGNKTPKNAPIRREGVLIAQKPAAVKSENAASLAAGKVETPLVTVSEERANPIAPLQTPKTQGIAPVTAHGFLEMKENDGFGTKKSMTSSAEMLFSLLLDPEKLIGDFMEKGDLGDVMRKDNGKYQTFFDKLLASYMKQKETLADGEKLAKTKAKVVENVPLAHILSAIRGNGKGGLG